MKKSITGSLLVFIFSSCIGISQTFHLSERNKAPQGSSTETAELDEAKYRDTLAIRKLLPSFGFDNIHGNASFISFLLYFGDDELRKQTGYGLSPDFFDVVTSRDPYYRDFYLFLTNSVSITAGQPERAVALMNKGVLNPNTRKVDNSFYIWRYKGVDELLFLGDSEAAKQSFRAAAEWAEESALEESQLMASLSKQTADFLEQNPDSKSAQIGAWSSMLTTARDDTTRTRAIKGIEALGGEVTIGENGGVTVKYAQTDEDTES